MEEAQGMMKLVEQLKEEREMLSATPSVSSPTSFSLQTLVRIVGAAYVMLFTNTS